MTTRQAIKPNTRVRRRRDGRIGTVCEAWKDAPAYASGEAVAIVFYDFGGGLPVGEATRDLEVIGEVFPQPDPAACGLFAGRDRCIFLRIDSKGRESEWRCRRFTADRWVLVTARGFTAAQRMPDEPWPACMRCGGAVRAEA